MLYFFILNHCKPLLVKKKLLSKNKRTYPFTWRLCKNDGCLLDEGAWRIFTPILTTKLYTYIFLFNIFLYLFLPLIP